MNDNNIDKLPVVDNEGRLVGTVSRKDLLEKASSFLRLAFDDLTDFNLTVKERFVT